MPNRYVQSVSALKNILVYSLMVVLLLFSNTSREWLHALSGHKDTVHTHQDDLRKGVTIESEHHHCKIFSYALPTFLSPSIYYQKELRSIYCTDYSKKQLVIFYHIGFRLLVSVRGPPLLS